MDVFVKRFGSDEPPRKIADVDDEQSIPDFKETVAEVFQVDASQIRLIDDGEWGSLLLESGTVDDISNNLVHMVVLPDDRTWDQFFFFVKKLDGDNVIKELVEADFLETVASVKSRLLVGEENRPVDSDIGLIYKWSQLKDEMAFDDEIVDIAVGCTLDLFLKESSSPDSCCQLIIKSTCFKNFTLVADLNETTEQLKSRIESQQGIAIGDQILMNMSSETTGQLTDGQTLAEQGVTNETVLALDVRPEAVYHLKVQRVGCEETYDLVYKFNDTIERLKEAAAEKVQELPESMTVLYEGRELEDDFKVYQYGICIDDVLQL